jgi:hypothetical protein
MYGRSGFRLLVVIVLVVGLAFLGIGAYNAGIAAGVAQGAGAAIPPGSVVAPGAIPYYYGWHPFGFGFGFLGFLGTLLFVFLIFGLIRAVAFGGRGRGWGGPGHWGPGGPGGPGGPDKWRNSPWAGRARETFDEWHRESHSGEAGTPPASPGPAGPNDKPGRTGQA